MSQGNRPLGGIAAEQGAGFGTSGVRGLVTSLTPGLCRAYAAGFLAMLGERPRGLLIGHDLRPSSPAIAAACHDAARARGVATINAGVLPTPALAFAAQEMGLPAIMVTGSHIPFDRNGLKFYRAAGEISKDDEQRILAASVDWPLDDAAPPPLPPPDGAAQSLYLARYRRAFGPAALAGLRIGVYEHSSVARDLLHEVLRALGAETVGLARSAGFVAIDTEAVRAEDRALALHWAGEQHLDAIVTTDGDADRPLVADETGTWLRGDMLGLLCAREIGAACVVTPVSSTTAIELSGLFRDVRRTRIGSPHVIAGMAQAQHRPVVGFEANGGFLLGSPAELGAAPLAPLATRDAVLPILLALSAARRAGRPLSSLMAELPRRHSFSDRLQDIDPARCRALLARAEETPAGLVELFGAPPQAVDRTDGLRATLPDGGILHVRLSGNAPELRCYAEAATAEEAERLCGTCLSRLQRLLSGTPGSSAAARR
ncbi:phosphomannomutase [Aestuariivirga litoralis]|uniref:Phosphomannomutase n=1 Tax=Aestuariivirga litoralis TaxID=2650924 RepID=A0A2W2BDZ4_9HYPH|nr:phosphomannomutase [Aestuariivirga litoralis]PZF78474.1 phosphomannomutase [Aestuariivirga litoralis]